MPQIIVTVKSHRFWDTGTIYYQWAILINDSTVCVGIKPYKSERTAINAAKRFVNAITYHDKRYITNGRTHAGTVSKV